MKVRERDLARKLRRSGWSLRAITEKTGCAKSSVSTWVRDIVLTDLQIRRLRSNQDRGRQIAARHPNSPRNKWAAVRESIAQKASREIHKKYSLQDLRIVGAALYWAEGYNASRNSVIFANTDPAMIKLMMRFFRDVCKVPAEKFRGKIAIHPHLSVMKAQKFWSRVSGIPLRQFNKASLAVSKASKNKRDTLPVGTFRIIINDVVCCSQIKGWIAGMKQWGD